MFEFCVLDEFVVVCRVFAWRSKSGVKLARRNILEQIVLWFVLFVMLARLHSGRGEWVSAPLREAESYGNATRLENICGIKCFCKAARFRELNVGVGCGQHLICVQTCDKSDRGAVWSQI